jgi:hypothetical protein
MNHRLSFKLGSFSACAVLAMAIAAGCSSSSSSDASNDGGVVGSGDGSASDGNGITGDGGVLSVCDKIPVADLQALLPATITSVDTTIGGGSNGGIICHVNVVDPGIGLEIQTYPDDADKSKFDFLLGGDPTAPDAAIPFTHAIAGIGDEAYYFEVSSDDAGTGLSSPNLAAHKSSSTGPSPSCGIESNDPPDTTMKTTAGGVGYTATQADVVAYVQLMGKVCNDVFAASN